MGSASMGAGAMRYFNAATVRSPGPTSVMVAAYLCFLLAWAVAPDIPTSTRLGAAVGLGLAWAYFALSIATAIGVIRARGARERPFTARLSVLALAAAIPLRFLGAYITGPAVPVDSDPTRYFPLLLLLTGVVGSWVIAPLVEEWVFRGYLLPEEPTWRDVTLNAIIFALLHSWQFTTLGPTLRAHAAVLPIGFALAAAKKLTRSTWACVALHFFINVAGVLTIHVTTEVQ